SVQPSRVGRALLRFVPCARRAHIVLAPSSRARASRIACDCDADVSGRRTLDQGLGFLRRCVPEHSHTMTTKLPGELIAGAGGEMHTPLVGEGGDAPPARGWDDVDAASLPLRKPPGATAPHDTAPPLGFSEPAATSLLCLLAQAGKVRICLVENARGTRH